MDFADTGVRAGEICDVDDSRPQCVRLRGDAKPGPERLLEKLSRRDREDGARRPLQVGARGGVRLARAEPDRDVDGDNLDVLQLGEVRLDWPQDVILGKPPAVEHDRDPSALRPIDAGNPHVRKVAAQPVMLRIDGIASPARRTPPSPPASTAGSRSR